MTDDTPAGTGQAAHGGSHEAVYAVATRAALAADLALWGEPADDLGRTSLDRIARAVVDALDAAGLLLTDTRRAEILAAARAEGLREAVKVLDAQAALCSAAGNAAGAAELSHEALQLWIRAEHLHPADAPWGARRG